MKTETFYFIDTTDKQGITTRHDLKSRELFDILTSETDPELQASCNNLDCGDHLIDQEEYITEDGIVFGWTTKKPKPEFNTDRQEFLQDIESTIDYLTDPDSPQPEDQPELMLEFQEKVMELSKIHIQLKMLGY